jgi:hypothetical protein
MSPHKICIHIKINYLKTVIDIILLNQTRYRTSVMTESLSSLQ